MCPLSLHESPSGSVMTGCSAGRVQLSRNLSQPPQRPLLSSVPTPRRSPGQNAAPRVTSVRSPRPTLAVGVEVPSTDDESQDRRSRSAYPIWRCRSAPWFDVLTQVRNLRVRCLVVVFLVLSLHSQSVMCSIPTPRQTETHVIYKTKLCRHVSEEALRASLSKESKTPYDMQGDDSNAGWGFSQSPYYDEEKENNAADREDDGYHQKKEFNYGLNVEAENEEAGEEEEEEEWDRARGYDDSKERTLRRALLRRRKNHHTSHRREERHLAVPDVRYSNDDTDSYDPNSLYSMRRRRRRRAVEQSTNPKEGRPQRAKDASRKNAGGDGKGRGGRTSSKSFRKSDDLQITSLQLSTKRNNRKIRKKLRKEFRQLVRKQNKPPPWECKFSSTTRVFKDNYYPTAVQDGKCESNKCFFNLYACEPIKYAVNLMERVQGYCNPLPLEGNATVYEEAWRKVTLHVTVGCKCASLAASGRRRRKN